MDGRWYEAEMVVVMGVWDLLLAGGGAEWIGALKDGPEWIMMSSG